MQTTLPLTAKGKFGKYWAGGAAPRRKWDLAVSPRLEVGTGLLGEAVYSAPNT